MKRSRLTMYLLGTVVALGALSTGATAAVIDTLLPVGSPTGFDMKNSGDPEVLAKFEELTGNSYTTSDLFRFDKGDGFTNITNVGNQWIIDVGSATPAYFMLKFGVGSTNTDLDTYFFRNVDSLRQLVFTNEQVNFLTGGACSAPPELSQRKKGANNNLDSDDNCNIGRLSHYIYVPGDGTGNPGGGEVPEPASLLLLGAGMAGMLARRRRR